MSLKSSLRIGLSSCPNDTFIFHALLHGLSSPDLNEEYQIKTHMADVEELNKLALTGELEVSKMSLGALPSVLDKYSVLTAGAALGWGVGPLLVSSRPLTEVEFESASIAIPGGMTTANLLLNLHGAFKGPRKEMLFSDIIPATISGEVDAGLIIHEGRFTYHKYGLKKVLDLGEWWEEKFSVPLPLGVIAVRRDVDNVLAKRLEKSISESVNYAWDHPDASREYIKRHAQEMEEEVMRSHINTFVTKFSANLGRDGKSAIEKILQSVMGNYSGCDIFLD